MIYRAKQSKFYTALLLLCIFDTIRTDQDPVHTPTFNNSPIFNTDIKPVFNCQPTFINYAISAVALTLYEKARKSLTKDNYDSLKNALFHIVSRYRYTLMIGSLLSSYSAINVLLYTHYSFITNPSLWINWKAEQSFIELCAIPAKDLEKELIRSIAQKYCNKKNPTDISIPLVTFIKCIDKEIGYINRYITIASIIKKCRFMKIFLTNETKIENARKLQDRAHFLKHIFLSWLGDYALRKTA